jgi:type I restriction enzyme, S subunit
MSDLPSGWTQTTMGKIADIKLGKMLDAAKNKGAPVQYLRNINVRWGSFDLSGLLEMRMTADELETYSIRDGDVLICEGGEPGRAAVWRSGPTNLKFQKALHRARACRGIFPEYLAHYLKYVSVTGEIERKFTRTTIKHLPLVAINELPLPLPPTSEQQRIVDKIDGLFEKSGRARQHLDHIVQATNARKLIDHLDQAILAKAFQGELVPQDPSDEPASVLLERIGAEREATPAERRRTGEEKASQRAIKPKRRARSKH